MFLSLQVLARIVCLEWQGIMHSTLQSDQTSEVVLVRWQKMMPRSSTWWITSKRLHVGLAIMEEGEHLAGNTYPMTSAWKECTSYSTNTLVNGCYSTRRATLRLRSVPEAPRRCAPLKIGCKSIFVATRGVAEAPGREWNGQSIRPIPKHIFTQINLNGFIAFWNQTHHRQ